MRQLYRTALQSAGFAVVGVSDGLEALNSIERERPAAVVLDLLLPRLQGRDVYADLAAHDIAGTIPIVIVSGDALRKEA